MRERLQTRQAQEAASSLNRVDKAKDVIENLGIVRLLLEAHQFSIDDVEALTCLSEELTQQVVHTLGRFRRNTPDSQSVRNSGRPVPVGSDLSVLAKSLILVASLRWQARDPDNSCPSLRISC